MWLLLTGEVRRQNPQTSRALVWDVAQMRLHVRQNGPAMWPVMHLMSAQRPAERGSAPMPPACDRSTAAIRSNHGVSSLMFK
jgi:hypothetical protein